MNGGGAEKLLLQFIHFFHENVNCEIHLLLTYHTGVYLEDIPDYVNKRFIFSEKSSNNEEKIKNDAEKISKKYISNNYDYAIAFLEGSATKLLAYADIPDILKYAWVHIDLDKRHYTAPLYKGIQEEKKCYRRFNKIAVVSNGVYNAFLKVFGSVFHNKLQVVYNPIDMNDIRKKAQEKCITYSKFTICSMGRLVSQKGYDRLIQSVAQLKAMGYDFNLIILGDGARRSELRTLIYECELENNVFLYGFIKNPYPYLAASNLYVCSSRTEGYCLAVCEAIALGKPIISTQCTGMPEVFELCNCGTIIPNSTEGITLGIKKFFDDHEYAYELQNRSKIGRFKLNYKVNLCAMLRFLNIEGDGGANKTLDSPKVSERS